MHRRACLTLALAAFALPAVGAAAPVTVDELHGDVSTANYAAFERFMVGHVDKVVGLKLGVPATKEGPISASVEGDLFVVYRVKDTQTETVAHSGFERRHDVYVFDGFFTVKHGGMHQGINSYALEPVAEATVRLNPAVRIKPVDLPR
jgi:hypothetical protein